MTPQGLPLTGQRVLVTRPAHQAAPLCRALETLGAEVLRFPTLAIAPTDDNSPDYPLLKNHFLELDRYHAVIFISANAARLGYEWIDTYWPQLPVGVHWQAVGKATARTLEELGIPAQPPSEGMDSEALLALPALQSLAEKRILICRGAGGREHLGETLTSRGALVDYAELYRRDCPRYADRDIESIIYKSPPSVMLTSSGEALDNLARLCRGARGNLPLSRVQALRLIVPSERVAGQARELGFQRIQTAENATDQAMIDALRAQDSTASIDSGK